MKLPSLIFCLILAVSAARAQIAMQAWAQRYHGAGSRDDQAYALAVDAGGRVFVAGGSSSATGSGSDCLTMAYSSAGVPLWTNRLIGLGIGYNYLSAMKADGSNVIVTGRALVTNNAADYGFMTIKYSVAGAALWTNTYSAPGNFEDSAVAVTTDRDANVLVTGYSTIANDGTWDYATIKYSSAGVGLWTNTYDGPANAYDRPYALAADTNGNVFVTGYSFASTYDFVTIAYSGAGDTLWTARFNGPGNGTDVPYALAVDPSGNVFVTGKSASLAGDFDCATIKYSGAGEALWTNYYNGPANGDDQAKAIAVDATGNVIVTGFSVGSGNYDCVTIKYANDGLPLWTNRYNGPGNGEDRANAVTVDTNSNVFVTGYSTGTNGTYDCLTIKYSSAGLPLWTNRYDGGGTSADIGNAVAADAAGNAFVTGYSTGTNLVFEFLTIKYSVIAPPGPLALQRVGNQIVLTWTNAAFSLQSAPAVTGTFTNLPGATSPHTNAITGARQFFRLISN